MAWNRRSLCAEYATSAPRAESFRAPLAPCPPDPSMAQRWIVRLQASLKDLDAINGLLRLLQGDALYAPVAELSGQILSQTGSAKNH
jgi:hypothetical protein